MALTNNYDVFKTNSTVWVGGLEGVGVKPGYHAYTVTGLGVLA